MSESTFDHRKVKQDLKHAFLSLLNTSSMNSHIKLDITGLTRKRRNRPLTSEFSISAPPGSGIKNETRERMRIAGAAASLFRF